MTVRFFLVCFLAVVSFGCGTSPPSKGDSSAAPSGTSSAGAAASGSSAPRAGSAAIGPDSVALEFLGRYEKGDAADATIPVFKITNRSDKKLHFVSAWHYYYDKDKRQIGRKFAERTVGTMEPGQSQEAKFGWKRADMPEGTELIEAVLVGANFEGGVVFKGDAKALAPETRPFGAAAGSSGSAPSPAAAAGDAAAATEADYAGLTGSWLNDGWGVVTIKGNNGTYTDTYGGGIGKLEITKTGERTYSVKWEESKARHGTMTLTLSADDKKLTGTWQPDPDVTIGGKTGGPVAWTKR